MLCAALSHPVTGGRGLVPTRPDAGSKGTAFGTAGPPGLGASWAWLLTPALPTDQATLALMKTPRCSLPDLPAAPARRRRQAPAPTKWNKRNLSWRWAGRAPLASPDRPSVPSALGPEVQDPSVVGLGPPQLRECLSPAALLLPGQPSVSANPISQEGSTAQPRGSRSRRPFGGWGWAPAYAVTRRRLLGSAPSRGTRPWAGTQCEHSCTTRSRSGATSRP